MPTRVRYRILTRLIANPHAKFPRGNFKARRRLDSPEPLVKRQQNPLSQSPQFDVYFRLKSTAEARNNFHPWDSGFANDSPCGGAIHRSL